MTGFAPPPPPLQGPAPEPPLWAPHYGIGFLAAFRRVWTKYATFSGRAGLGEYWWWVLAEGIVVIALYVLMLVFALIGAGQASVGLTPLAGGGIIVGMILLVAWELAVLVPNLALVWRRLHDANLSGAFWFLTFVPFGGIVVFVLLLLPSNPAGARFDRPPGWTPAPYGTPPGYAAPPQQPPTLQAPPPYPPQSPPNVPPGPPPGP